MNIGFDGHRGPGLQLIKGDYQRSINCSVDCDVVDGEVLIFGDVANMKDRKTIGEVLPRRKPCRVNAALLEVFAVAIEKTHPNSFPRPGLQPS